MSTHAELSPSKRHRWGACPGSIRMEAPFPEPPSGEAAIDGTRSHAMLEECIKANVYVIPDAIIGSTRTDEYGTWTVDAGRINRVNLALAYIKERALAAETKPIAEERVFPDGLVNRADLHGTVDCQIPGKDVYEIIDYKDGVGVVAAENNPQLEQYALGVLAKLEPKQRPKSFQLTIIQPKLTLKGMPAISTWNISTKALLDKVVPTIVAQAAATEDPNAPLVPGDSQCKYCRAKAVCPALQNKAMEGIGLMFQTNNPVLPPTIDVAAVTVEQEVTEIAHQAAQKDPSKMDDKELRQILEGAPLVRQLLDGVEKEVKRRLEAGQKVEGFKLVRGRGSRTWALSIEEMEKKLTTTMKIPKAALYVKKLPTPAAIKDITWEKDGQVHRLSPEQIAKIEKEWVKYTEGGLVVAPEGDSRPAVVTDVSAMFGGAIPVEAEVVTPPSPPAFLNVAVPSFFNVSPPVPEPVATPDPLSVLVGTPATPESPPPVALPSFFNVG